MSVQAVEVDAAAAATYSLNHPATKVFIGPIQEWSKTDDVPQVTSSWAVLPAKASHVSTIVAPRRSASGTICGGSPHTRS